MYEKYLYIANMLNLCDKFMCLVVQIYKYFHAYFFDKSRLYINEKYSWVQAHPSKVQYSKRRSTQVTIENKTIQIIVPMVLQRSKAETYNNIIAETTGKNYTMIY